MSRFIAIISLVITVFCVIAFYRERNFRELAEKRVAYLEKELGEEKESLEKKSPNVVVKHSADEPAAKLPEVEEVPPDNSVESSEGTKSPSPSGTRNVTFSVNARLSAIEKFVEIDDGERERLKRKFETELSQRAKPKEKKVDTESLEDILGRENASFYLEQRQQAFDRAQLRSIEKEVLYLSRTLELSSEQEDRLRNNMIEIEETVKVDYSDASQHSALDKYQRLKMLLEESRLRQELQYKRFKEIFSPEQYQGFLEDQGESPGADLELWHGDSHK